MRLRSASIVLLALSVCWSGPGTAQAAAQCEASVELDACANAPNPVAACQALVRADPYDLYARIALCETFVRTGELLKAMVTVQQGLDQCGRRSYNCARLRVALSNVQELAERQTPDVRAERVRELEVWRGYCIGPSASDASIQACNEALVSLPEDGALYVALGDKYARRSLTALAVLAYRNAAERAVAAPELVDKITNAERAREAQAQDCLGSRDLQSCDAAALSGAADEFDVQRHRGDLLLESGRDGAALEAFLIAQSLQPRDTKLARRVLQLLDSRLQEDVGNPALLLAHADALLATGRVDAALVAYQRVPSGYLLDTDGDARQARARNERAGRVQRQCLGGNEITVIAACRRLLLAGEPDERQIRGHIENIQAKRADRVQRECLDGDDITFVAACERVRVAGAADERRINEHIEHLHATQRTRRVQRECLDGNEFEFIAACEGLLKTGAPDEPQIAAHIDKLRALFAPDPKPPPPPPPPAFSNAADIDGATH